MSQLAGKIALVTGGTRGIGRETILRLCQNGCNRVIFTYNSRKDLADAMVAELNSKGCTTAALQLNMADNSTLSAFKQAVQAELQHTFESPHFHFLINNAGSGAQERFAEATEESFDTLCNIHFRGVFFLTQMLLDSIADGGRIINVSSGLARFSIPGYAAYGCMKGAVEVLTRYLSKELGARRITVNTVAPGAIDNDFNKERFEKMPKAKDTLISLTNLGRVGTNEDVGGVIAFLCSEEAGWVNAQRIEIAGGIFTREETGRDDRARAYVELVQTLYRRTLYTLVHQSPTPGARLVVIFYFPAGPTTTPRWAHCTSPPLCFKESEPRLYDSSVKTRARHLDLHTCFNVKRMPLPARSPRALLSGPFPSSPFLFCPANLRASPSSP